MKTPTTVLAVLLGLVVLTGTTAFAEEQTVEVGLNGFSQPELFIDINDSVIFENTDLRDYGSVQELEGHCISDPFAVPYTEESCYLTDNYTPTWTVQFNECGEYTFYDRSYETTPLVITICGEQSGSEETPTYDLVDLQEELMSVTAEYTATLETIALLQTEVSSLTQQVAILEAQEFDTTSYDNQISSLESQVSTLTSEKAEVEADRDSWKALSDNWYAVAMEQLRIMVDVLGL